MRRARQPRRHASGPVLRGLGDRVLRSSAKLEAGFTLLELLIATAVSAVVLIAIQTAFFGGLRLHMTAHARMDTDLELQRALTIIRRDFAGLMLPAAGNGSKLVGQLQSDSFSSVVSADFVSYFAAPASSQKKCWSH